METLSIQMIKVKSYPVLLKTEVCSSSSLSPDCSLSESIFERCNIIRGLNAQLNGENRTAIYSKSLSELHKHFSAFFFFFDKSLVFFDKTW